MDRLTRHELKQDDFRETLDQLEQYLKAHLKEILTVAILVIVVVGLAGGLKYYLDQQEASANIELASALRTFQSYVGTVTPDTLGAESETFLNAADKYQKAREQFNAIVLKYRMFPRPKAVSIARYHVGVCEALLGNSAAAINTLQEASRDGDREIAALAQFALAGEFLKTGKKQEAVAIYQHLVDHPSLAVPRASALLALADSLKDSQPGQARKLYEQIQKEFGSDPSIAEALKQQMAGLPQ
ncbi:MAG: tetratricopeptide repeat protein [Terriglobia bacterium]|jgi:TolA-binding protein